MKVTAIVIALGAIGCRQVLGIEPGGVRSDATIEIDAPPDTSNPDTMIDAPFMGWQNIAPVLPFTAGDEDPTLPSDMLEIYFSRGNDIFFSTRTNVNSAWSTPQMAMFAQSMVDNAPEMTPEGLILQFASDRGPGSTLDIYFVIRNTRSAGWAAPDVLDNVNDTSFNDRPGSATATGSYLTLSSDRNALTGLDLYEAFRPGPLGTAYNAPVRMPLSTTLDDGAPFLTNDGLTLYYASGPNLSRDLYVATRAALTDPFTTGMPITELNTPDNDSDPWVSPDGKEIYFSSNRDGAQRIWHASRP